MTGLEELNKIDELNHLYRRLEDAERSSNKELIDHLNSEISDILFELNINNFDENAG